MSTDIDPPSSRRALKIAIEKAETGEDYIELLNTLVDILDKETVIAVDEKASIENIENGMVYTIAGEKVIKKRVDGSDIKFLDQDAIEKKDQSVKEEINSDLKQLKSRVETVESNISSNDSDLSDLQTEVEDIKQNLSELQTRVDDKMGKIEIDGRWVEVQKNGADKEDVLNLRTQA